MYGATDVLAFRVSGQDLSFEKGESCRTMTGLGNVISPGGAAATEMHFHCTSCKSANTFELRLTQLYSNKGTYRIDVSCPVLP